MSDYELDICRRWTNAEKVPFKQVAISNWRPMESKCHENVDFWVHANASSRIVAIRGWINSHIAIPNAIRLTPHSVVKGPHDKLFDITPFADERLRPHTRFVRHIGSEEDFNALKRNCLFIDCPSYIAGPVAALILRNH
jgi:hypothetical protein